jgi:hypothetical protein
MEQNIKNIKGTIEKITFRGEGEKKSFGIAMLGQWYSGWGECPYKEGEDVEFQYIEKDVNGKVYKNIYKPSKIAEKVADVVVSKVGTKLDDLIMSLNMPKISVMVEKTIQEEQFEPKKVSCHISMNVDDVTPEKIAYLIKMAEIEVLNIAHSTKGTPQPSKFPILKQPVEIDLYKDSNLIYASPEVTPIPTEEEEREIESMENEIMEVRDKLASLPSNTSRVILKPEPLIVPGQKSLIDEAFEKLEKRK